MPFWQMSGSRAHSLMSKGKKIVSSRWKYVLISVSYQHYGNIYTYEDTHLCHQLWCQCHCCTQPGTQLTDTWWKKAHFMIRIFIFSSPIKVNQELYFQKFKSNQRCYLSFWRGRVDRALQSHVQDWHSSTPTWSLHQGTDVSKCPFL